MFNCPKCNTKFFEPLDAQIYLQRSSQTINAERKYGWLKSFVRLASGGFLYLQEHLDEFLSYKNNSRFAEEEHVEEIIHA